MLLSSSMRSLTCKELLKVGKAEEGQMQPGTCASAHHLSEVVLFVQEVLPCRHKLLKFPELLLNLRVQLCGERLPAVLPKVQGSV